MPVACYPMQANNSQQFRYRWFALGDLNAFFALMFDNVANLALFGLWLTGVVKIPAYIFYKKMTLHTIYTPHLWSMSFEEQFYVVFFFFLFFTPKQFLKPIGIFMLVAIPIVRILGYLHMNKNTDDHELVTLILSRNALFQIDTFFYGILLALIKIDRTKIWIYLTLFFGSLFLFLLIYTSYLTSVNLNIQFY